MAGHPTAQSRPSRVPRQRDFWRLWLVGLVMAAVRWVEMLVTAIFTYQVTGSAFIVTMMTMLRVLPWAMFGAFLGAWADRVDRRLALLGFLVAMLLSSAAIVVLAYTNRLEVWHLAVCSFIGGTVWASDSAVRRMLIGDVVGVDGMATAIALDTGANNASRVAGPALGGLLMASGGVDVAFLFSGALYLLAIAAMVGLKSRGAVAHPEMTSMLKSIVEGLRELRRRRDLQGILAVTAIYNLFGWPFYSLVPVIGKDSLGLGPEGIGVLSSMDGLGAMAAAAWVILLVRPRHYQTLYIAAAVAFQLMMVGFALTSRSVPAAAFLVLAGLSGAGLSVMQTTLLYRAVAPQMRSRMMGLLAVSIGLGPIGFVELGVLAEQLGAKLAIIVLAIQGLLAVALTFPLWRRLGAADGSTPA